MIFGDGATDAPYRIHSESTTSVTADTDVEFGRSSLESNPEEDEGCDKKWVSETFSIFLPAIDIQ